MALTSKIAVFACALIVISGVYVVYSINGDSLDLTDRELVLVISDSMDGDEHGYEIGSFPAGTMIMVQHILEHEKRFLKVGDVISYKSQGSLFHHRITEVNSDSVYVQGDNNHSTEKVYLPDINGKVVGTNVVLGHAASFVSNNFYLFLGIMFVLSSVLIVFAVYLPNKPKREVGYY
jgi:hypothetical protein